MLLAYTFATFHRFTAISYKVPAVEVMAGCAVAMAKYNGLDKVGHIRDKLADIAAYVETLRALTNAAANDPGHVRGHRRPQSPDRQHGQAPFCRANITNLSN